MHRSRVCVVKIFPWRRSQTQRKKTSLSYQNRKHQISVENLQASVAGFILGYLREEGLYRTCSAFQDECSLFHDDNKELDYVFLTADLKTILDDYSQLRESGRENGVPSSTAVLKSLWKDLDVVIGQLKYATIPSSTPQAYMGSQSTRTRRLNHGRTRRSMLPKNQESITSTASNPSTTHLPAKPSGSYTTEKLPLPRLTPVESSPNLLLQSSSEIQTVDLPSTNTNRVTQNGVQSITGREPVNVHRTPSTVKSVGSAVAISSPCVRGESQVFGTSIDLTSTVSTVAKSTSDELSKNADIVEGMFDGVDEGSVLNNEEMNHGGTETKSPPVIVIDDESNPEQRVLNVEEHSLSQSHHSQDELQLRSPKRKGIQPKKRVPQGASGTSIVNDSPVKPVVPETAEVEMDIVCSSDSLTPQSFLGTLLSTPLLQEKLAENINKVVGSTRQQSASDEPPSDTMQSLTTTEASSDDILTASNQGAGGDIPVKEIMDLMQADPAFDVLFSFFGLDALDALPSAANSVTDSNTGAVLPETSAGSSQLDKPTSCVSSSAVNLPDALATSSLPEECPSDSGKEITSMSTASDQQVETPCSSSASDLHLSATSIVTDALLLLAGSPQKIPPQVQLQLDHSASVLSSGKQNLITPPKKTQSVQEPLDTNDKGPNVDSLTSQASLITSLFPYVRALDFSLDKEPEPVKRGRKRSSKTKKGARQKTTTDEQSKAPLTKKGARSNKSHLEAIKSPSSSFDAAVGHRNVQAVLPSTVVTNISVGTSRPISNCGSVFNRSTNQISSTVITGACSNTSPYNMNNCGTLATGFPTSACSLATGPSLSPGNMVQTSSGPVPSAVSCMYVNPSANPTSSLVNSTSGPVNFTSAVTSCSLSPANRTTLGGSPVLVNRNNSSTNLTPSTVNYTTCGTIRSPFIPGYTGSIGTSAPVHLTMQHVPGASSTVSFINPVACPTSASSVNLANTTNSHPALPASFGVSSVSSLHQAVNTVTSSHLTGLTQAVTPSHFTDSSVVTLTTSINNSLTSQEQNASESNGSGTSATNVGVVQTTVGPFTLQASNLLQSLALQHANTEKNEPQNTESGLDITLLRKESTQSFQKIAACSTLESGHRHQSLKEKSTSKKNVNLHLSQDNATVSSEKHNDISVVCEGGTDPLRKDLRDTVAVVGRLPNSLENKNGGTSTLTIMNQGCRELMKENSSGFLQSETSSETEGQEVTKPQGKRRRDSLQKEKEKKTKSSSRPSKKSKTKAESINFPSDLNVEDFLSKLHYEVK